jgi:glycosyltransferase involved in cell wall biosynthesis
MKIVINAASTKMGGAVRYLAALLRHLSAAHAVEFTVFLPPDTARMLHGYGSNVHLLPTQISHAGTLRRLCWEQVTLRRFLKRQKADCLFSTANFAMFRCPVRQLLLITNPLYSSKIYREHFLPRHTWRYRLAYALRCRLVWQSVRAADVVITPTKAMLDDLRRYVKVKMAVVNPFGVEMPALHQKRQNETARQSDAEGNRVIRLLYVSLYSEHKNLNTLLKAMAILNSRTGARFRLITTADPAWAGAAWTVTSQEDVALARQGGIAEHVEFIGPLSREEADALYRQADIFVFPSVTESFGFPMAEAMSHGLPVLAADTPVNREVCGQAAIYFDPLDAGDLAARLLDLAADGALCCRLGEMGRQEAARRFCWSAHAARIVDMAAGHGRCGCPGYQAVSPAQ